MNKESLTTRMTYDKDGRLASITEGKNTVRFAYDRFGRKLMEDGPVGTLTMMYDGKGRLTARQVQFKNSKEKFLTEYAYDEYDRVVSVKSPSGVFNYTWTKDNKIATQSVGDKKVVNTYDKAGRLTSKMFGDTVLAKYEYDELDRRVKGQYFDVKWDYSYDQYNQLVNAYAGKPINNIYSFYYNDAGQRNLLREKRGETAYKTNILGQCITEENFDGRKNNLQYDKFGNMTKNGQWSFVWDLKNRLITAKNENKTIEFEYDYASRLIGRKVIEKGELNCYSKSLYADFVMVAKLDSAKHMIYFTWNSEDLLALSDSRGIKLSILKDGNRNVIALIDSDGAINTQYIYLPFGSIVEARGDYRFKNPFRFSCEQFDDDLNLVYYNFRYYSPSLGCWLSRDPLFDFGLQAYGKSLKTPLMRDFVFVDNNPVSNHDQWGLTSCKICPAGAKTITSENGLTIYRTKKQRVAGKELDLVHKTIKILRKGGRVK